MNTTCTRHQDIDCGHRVVRQGGACERLHGHTYRIHFTCTAAYLNAIGMVIDFGVMKSKLCQWLLDNWDHRFLGWQEDELLREIFRRGCLEREVEEGITGQYTTPTHMLCNSIVWVPFNPTAELIADHLLNVVGPTQLAGTGVQLIRVTVDETRKCSATATLERWQ